MAKFLIVYGTKQGQTEKIAKFIRLLFWAVLIRFASDTFFKLQSYWFPMPKEKLIVCNYVMYGMFKLIILVFNLVPFLVLRYGSF